jgi:myosin-5
MILHNQYKNKFKLNENNTESIDEKTSANCSLPPSYDSNDVNTSSEGSKSKRSNNSKTAAPTMRSEYSNTSNGTRVWVKKSALDAVRNPKLSFKEKMSRKPPLNTSFNGGPSFNGSMSIASAPYSKQTSFNSSIGGGGSVASFASQRDPFNDSDLDIGSIGITPYMNQNSSRSSEQWGWTSACMIDSSDGKITLQLDEAPLNSASSDTSSASLFSFSSSNGNNNMNNDQVVVMPGAAMSDGDIVMANDYELSNDGNPICPHDLISLSHLHEPAVVECLQQRYENDRIYTATGPVLLALNPFQNIQDLYGESTMKLYWEKSENQSKETLPPHVYAIADEAFRNMMRSLDQSLGVADTEKKCCDQSILVSGESGAGKTVTTKFVMKYLAALSQRAGSQKKEKRAYEKVADEKKEKKGRSESHSSATSYLPPTSSSSGTPSWVSRSKTSNTSVSTSTSNNNNNSVGGIDALSDVANLAGSNSIEAQVLQSNPILESFGNARTMRNDNSSRFGKFIEIQFTRTGRLVGAQIETYLLEKVRLVTQSPGERNYHIFYEMLSGSMGADELRNYFIASSASPDDFKITASGTFDRRDGVSDKDTCFALQAAMRTMKFSVEEQRNVFATTAAILHASNLTFCDFDQYCQLDGRNVHLEPVCHLLGVSAEDLNQALCHCSITAGRESQVQQNLDIDKAEKGLEALLKATYGALFTFLVTRINDSICYYPDEHKDSKDAPSASIGVLDIFGFESFKTNSFEQLCINYCNEALQQQFNAFVLKNEQAEYEREGIEWSFIEFPENQDVIDLIDKRGSGILCILDDQCRAPGTSDRSFALDVYNKSKNHIRFSANRKQTALLQFCVNHYAGPVEYTTHGFVEKNRDELPKEATELLQNSFNPFIRELSSMMENASAERQGSASFGKATVGGQFRRQLKRLREKIDLMSPHYIRCLKPNDQLVPDHFDRAAVAEQLSCGGILEAVRVARAGYSNHYTHEDFVRRYRCLGWDTLKTSTKPQERIGGSPQPKKKFFAGAVSSPRSENSVTTSSNAGSTSTVGCKTLVQHLCRLLQQQDQKDGDNDENEKNSANTAPNPANSQAKTYKHQVSYAAPSWSRGGSNSSYKTTTSDSRPPAPPATPELNRKSHPKNIGGTTSESAKVGIQIGKTKVFLRHKAFESLERMRSQEQSRAAVRLNSIFRMYLARMAYVHVRNAVRTSMFDLQTLQSKEWDETKDEDSDDGRLIEFYHRLNQMRHSFGGQSFSLVEAWACQMRESIHNPTPRSEWGKMDSSKPFEWMLVDGLWIKNHDLSDVNL